MKYLLDASALLPLVTRLGKELVSKASREYLATLDLGVYEACNSIWKLSTLIRSITLDEGIEIAGVLGELTGREVIHLVDVAGLQLQDTLRLAYHENLTFYDASYVTAAKHESAILVTEDAKLRESARKHVETIDLTSLEHRLA